MSEEKAGQSQSQEKPKSDEVQAFSVKPSHPLPHFKLPHFLGFLRSRKVWLPLVAILICVIAVLVWWTLFRAGSTPTPEPTQSGVFIPTYTKSQIETQKHHQVIQGTIQSINSKQIMVTVDGKTHTFLLTKSTAYYHLDTYKPGKSSDVKAGQQANVTYDSQTNQAESVWYK